MTLTHEQELRHAAERDAQTCDAVSTVLWREWQCLVERVGNRHPVGCRVHLLFGQIEVASSHVLVGVEPDLLETNDPGHNVDLTVTAPISLAIERLKGRDLGCR